MAEKITEEERLRLQLYAERQQRLEAEQMNLEMTQKAMGAAMGAFVTERAAFGAEMRTKYTLLEGDNIDIKTGAISRKNPPPAAPPAPMPTLIPPAPPPPATPETPPAEAPPAVTGTVSAKLEDASTPQAPPTPPPGQRVG